MKKELIRSLIAINQASSAMALQQQASRITTTVGFLYLNFILEIVVFFSALDGFSSS